MDRPDPPCRLRVLTVDDNRDSADSLALLLGLWGHEARAVYDGPAALAAVPEFAPDVLFLDLGLPRMSGFEVARQVREAGRGRSPALVAVTGYTDAATRDRVLSAGFDHLLIKPADPVAVAGLLDRVGRLARLAEQTRELVEQNAQLTRQGAELARGLRDAIRDLRGLRPPDPPAAPAS